MPLTVVTTSLSPHESPLTFEQVSAVDGGDDELVAPRVATDDLLVEVVHKTLRFPRLVLEQRAFRRQTGRCVTAQDCLQLQ